MKRTILCLIVSFVLAFSFPVLAYAKGSVARVVVPSKPITIAKPTKSIQSANMIQKYGFVSSCALSSKTPRIKRLMRLIRNCSRLQTAQYIRFTSCLFIRFGSIQTRRKMTTNEILIDDLVKLKKQMHELGNSELCTNVCPYFPDCQTHMEYGCHQLVARYLDRELTRILRGLNG